MKNSWLLAAAAVLSAILLFPCSGMAQKRKIRIVNADSLVFSQERRSETRILYGNVQFEHQGSMMFCDSAYFYGSDNSFDAFGNVRIEQGDSVTAYGDTLFFEGDTRIAKLRSNVKLIDRQTILLTNILDYNLRTGTAAYFGTGSITSGNNLLVSREGFYYEPSNEFYFQTRVVITTPGYILQSDSLWYSTVTETSRFRGPTEIIGDSTYMYCLDGWHDSKNEKALCRDSAYIRNKTSQIWADSIYYCKHTPLAEAFGSVLMKDTAQNTEIRSRYARYVESTGYLLATDSLMAIIVLEGDTLYLHADTLASMPDSLGNREFWAYYKTRFFKSDFQGKCDSMHFTLADSIMRMRGKPVLWTESHQATAELIDMVMKDGQLEKIVFTDNAFLCSEEAPDTYNQIKGASMTGYVRNREIYRLDVSRNGQTIYYLYDEDEMIGVNKAECEDITVHIAEGQINQIVFKKRPTGTMYPPGYLPKAELFLRDFNWMGHIRPTGPEDIFNWRE
jgi:lipopolysaccharide export system protein LptA